jgi:hypothetical protein
MLTVQLHSAEVSSTQGITNGMLTLSLCGLHNRETYSQCEKRLTREAPYFGQTPNGGELFPHIMQLFTPSFYLIQVGEKSKLCTQ